MGKPKAKAKAKAKVPVPQVNQRVRFNPSFELREFKPNDIVGQEEAVSEEVDHEMIDDTGEEGINLTDNGVVTDENLEDWYEKMSNSIFSNIPFRNPAIDIDKLSPKERKALLEREAYLRRLILRKQPQRLIKESLLIWEEIHSAEMSDEKEKEKSLTKLAKLVKGNSTLVLFPRESAHVLQCLFYKPQFFTPLFKEFTPQFVEIMRTKPAFPTFKKLLRVCNQNQISIIVGAVSGHCATLLQNGTAAQALEALFEECASENQLFSIVSDFYGSDFTPHRHEFRGGNIKEVFEKYPMLKDGILGEIRETLDVIVHKVAIQYTLTHRLLREYITHCSTEHRITLIEQIAERVPEILHTSDGTYVSLECVWHGTPADHAQIVGNFNSSLIQACTQRCAHLVFLAIFDCVQDTELVNKHIVKEIGYNICELMEEKYGQNILQYLIHPRDESFFSKTVLELLNSGHDDPCSTEAGRVRYAQLFSALEDNLMVRIAANMREMLFKPFSLSFIRYMLEKPAETVLFERTIDDELRLACCDSIKELVEDDIEEMSTYLDLTGIIRFDTENDVKLSNSLAGVTEDQLRAFINCKHGCSVLAAMLDYGEPNAVEAVRSAITPALLLESKDEDAAVLLKKLQD